MKEDRQTDREKDRQTEEDRQTEIDRQRDRRTNRDRRQTDRQTEKKRERKKKEEGKKGGQTKKNENGGEIRSSDLWKDLQLDDLRERGDNAIEEEVAQEGVVRQHGQVAHNRMMLRH